MKEVEHTMGSECDNNQPEVGFEADNGDDREHAYECRFYEKRLGGAPHYREQQILGSDHDQQSGIHGTIPIEADELHEKSDKKSEDYSDGV